VNENATGTPQPRVARRRAQWVIGCCAVAVVVAAAAAIAFLPTAFKAIPIRLATARAIAAAQGPAAIGSPLEASGHVVALREATVSGKRVYKVNQVLVKEGQQVKQGQVIALLDDSNVNAELEQSEAQVKLNEAVLAAAKLAADDVRPSFLRNQTQLAEGLINHDTFDTSKSNYDAAQAAQSIAEQNLAVTRATVEINQRYEDDTVIKAPFDGLVTVLTARPGELVSPQFSGGGGIAKIVDLHSLEVEVDVGESMISRVHLKQGATIALNAYPEWRIPAEVIAIIPAADRAKAAVKVRIGFKLNDPRVIPEMGAHVLFLDTAPQPALIAATPTQGVIVPVAAVMAQGDAEIVFVITGDHMERRAVRLGARTAGGQEILSGLEPGAILAIGNFAKLRDGSRVCFTP
jgi:RND family efflux transporter MFP subunit